MKEILIYFILLCLIGTILHFTYHLSKENIVVGIFSAVNESVWEHIKILLTPIFLINTISYVIEKENDYFISLFIQLLLAIIIIISLYKIKVGIFKDKHNYLNILSFFITSLVVSISRYYLTNITLSNSINFLGLIGTLIIFAMYLSFSVFPPKTEIFKDPITNTYGISKL